jgi:hypothetical protein
VVYEWDPAKAASNLRCYGVSFAEATSVFRDQAALTFGDPDHSDKEEGEESQPGIEFFSYPTAPVVTGFGSSAHGRPPAGRGASMPKGLVETTKDGLRCEYDLSQLLRRVRGKYYRQAKTGTNLVLIEPDVAKAFPDQESVNRALRRLVRTASATTRASRRPRKDRTAPNQRPKRRHSGR